MHISSNFVLFVWVAYKVFERTKLKLRVAVGPMHSLRIELSTKDPTKLSPN